MGYAAMKGETAARITYEAYGTAGLVLLPPATPGYEAMVTEIRDRSALTPTRYIGAPAGAGLQDQVTNEMLEKQRGKSAIFLNKSEKSVAQMQVLWLYRGEDGQEIVGGSAWVGAQILLLPFGVTPDLRKPMSYWFPVLAGSKRYLSDDGTVLGDNTDVRPPAADEIFRGGGISGSGGGTWDPVRPMDLCISIDGAFFEDGGFIGRNRGKLFERTVASANAHKKMAQMAALTKGDNAAAILDAIEKESAALGKVPKIYLKPDPSTPADLYEKVAFRRLADAVKRSRTPESDTRTVETIKSWLNVGLPAFRKLASA